MLNGFPILNVFPDLLTLEPLAPFILRVVVGIIIMNIGYLKWKGEHSMWKISFEALGLRHNSSLVKGFGVLEFLIGLSLFVGIYTQLSALILAIISGLELFAEHKESALVKRDVIFYILIFAIALSLLFTGAGAFSFDLPL